MIKIFISHAEEDSKAALDLKRLLEQHGFSVYSYELDTGFAANISQEVQKAIDKCDHFLVLLSESAVNSEWVGRELGLAITLQKQKQRIGRPSIIGIWYDPKGPHSIYPRRYGDGSLYKRPYDFKDVRNLDLSSADDVSYLAKQFGINHRFIETDSDTDNNWLKKSFHCYEILFPIKEERDKPGDISYWLTQSRLAAHIGSPWREIYAVLYTGDIVIGMAFLSLNLRSHWCFGNYFGILAGWRQDGRAQIFFEGIEKKLKELDGEVKGILFEIESVDPSVLKRALQSKILGKIIRNDMEVRDNIRQLRRLRLYTHYRAKVLMESNGTPLPYWQPAMEPPLDETNEVPLILMGVMLKDETSVKDAINFIYDDLYGDAYAYGDTYINGFKEYCYSLKDRVLSKCSKESRFAEFRFPEEWRQLIHKANEEHLNWLLSL